MNEGLKMAVLIALKVAGAKLVKVGYSGSGSQAAMGLVSSSNAICSGIDNGRSGWVRCTSFFRIFSSKNEVRAGRVSGAPA